MRLTERDQDKLRAALDVALGCVSTEDADLDGLGLTWRLAIQKESEVRHFCRNTCRAIILDLIVKAGEPEPGNEGGKDA